jgi:hypothetical protein
MRRARWNHSLLAGSFSLCFNSYHWLSAAPCNVLAMHMADYDKALEETARRFSSCAFRRGDDVYIHTSSCDGAPGRWRIVGCSEEAKLSRIAMAEYYCTLTAESTNRKARIHDVATRFDRSPRSVETAIAEYSVTARSDAVK